MSNLQVEPDAQPEKGQWIRLDLKLVEQETSRRNSRRKEEEKGEKK